MSDLFIRPEHRPDIRASMDAVASDSLLVPPFEEALSVDAWRLSGCKEDKGDKNKEGGKDDKGGRAPTKDYVKLPKRSCAGDADVSAEVERSFFG